MNVSRHKSMLELDCWKEDVKEVAEKSDNECVKHALKNIIENNASEEFSEDEYFRFVATILNDLTCLELERNDMKVIDLITNVMRRSSLSNILSAIRFAKINLKIIHKNISEAVKSTVYVENFIKTICELITTQYAQETQNESQQFQKIIKVQLCIIIQIQSLFPTENFVGNCYIIDLFITLINADIEDLEENFMSILRKQLEDPKFYKDIFLADKFQSYGNFLQYCSFIAQSISHCDEFFHHAMTREKENNFLCMLITSLANNLDVLATDAEIFEGLIQEIVNLIIKSNENNFEVVERELIEGILSDNYSLSVICFYIFCEFLLSIESLDSVQSYFILLQEILLNLWRPSCSLTEIRQVYIVKLLDILYTLHIPTLKPFINPGLMCLFEDNEERFLPNDEISTQISKLKDEPIAENYYNLLTSMSHGFSDQKSSKDLIELMEIIGVSDWNIFTSIVLKAIDFIAVTNDAEMKMIYLLKLDPLKGMRKFEKDGEMCLQIAHKLLEMVLTFMSKGNGYDGLKNYTKELLQSLLDVDISVRRLYLNSPRHTKTVTIKEESTLFQNVEDILKSSKLINLKDACQKIIKISSDTESSQLENLEKMLAYSKWLTTQLTQLTNSEKNVIDEIVSNLQSASSLHKSYSF